MHVAAEGTHVLDAPMELECVCDFGRRHVEALLAVQQLRHIADNPALVCVHHAAATHIVNVQAMRCPARGLCVSGVAQLHPQLRARMSL
jgi:hypothetical protein